ncbi:hypothetical protein FRC12_004176 [Ceratobasidium sp. 428]|nr:hypothetical protein FRC12_004176 [Ceratobasidium sp. 428]
MPSNFTVDDYSPLIQYRGQWYDSFNISLDLDPFARRYRDNSFHSSFTNGSTASLTFKGIAVYIFGAKRGNHGFYHVSVDGEPGQQFDGFATSSDGTDGVYQVPLFAREGLADGQHTIALTNIVNMPARRPFVDIDYITWTQKNDVSFGSEITEDPGFQYSTPTSVWTPRTGVDGFRSGTVHSTNTYGAAASLKFEGSEVFLYGSTGPNHGQYKIQLDNQLALELNGTAPALHTQTLLYTTSDLAPGEHQLVITNLGDNQALDVDFAEVVPHKSKSYAQPHLILASPLTVFDSTLTALRSMSTSDLTKGAMVGIIVGIVIGVALVLLLLWSIFMYRRRKNKRQFTTDLMSPSEDPQSPTMGSYPNNLYPIIVEPYVDHPNPTGQGQSAPYSGAVAVADGRGERSNSQPNSPTVLRNQRKGAARGTVNRGANDSGLRPEPVTSEGGSSSGPRWTVETDGGVLPPLYDQQAKTFKDWGIESVAVNETDTRSGLYQRSCVRTIGKQLAELNMLRYLNARLEHRGDRVKLIHVTVRKDIVGSNTADGPARRAANGKSIIPFDIDWDVKRYELEGKASKSTEAVWLSNAI